MKRKRILAMLLACVMLFTLLGVPAFAAESLPTATDGVITLTEDVTLTINVTFNEFVTINLNNKTLTATKLIFNGGAEIYGGTISFDGAYSADGFICADYKHYASSTVTIRNATISAENSIYNTGVLYAENADDTFILDNVQVNVSGGNTDPGSGVFYSPSSSARGKVVLKNNTSVTATKVNAVFFASDLNVDGAVIDCGEVYRPVFRQAAGTVNNTTVTIDSIETGRAIISDEGNAPCVLTFTESTITAPEGTAVVNFKSEGSKAEADDPMKVGGGAGVTEMGTLADTSWYNDTDTSFTLSDKADLYGFTQLVNNGNSFAKKTVTLDADIDLTNEDWTPIGDQGKTFSGKFDGGNHTISNVYVSERTYANVGFFGYTSNGASIENLKLHNVEVTSTSKAVGAVVGNAYTGTGIKNVLVTGKIAVSGGWYVGGINGGMSYVAYENCTVDGSNTEGFESYIKSTVPGNYTNYVGGICGLAGEGGGGIRNCDVKNIKLLATEGVGVGGICGVMQYDYTIKNCSVSNVQLVHESNEDGAAWTGTIAGKDYSKAYDTNGNVVGVSAIINCEVSGVTASVNGEALTDIFWMGHDHTGTYPPYDEYTPQTVIGTEVTYDESGKINGGKLILVGNNDVVKNAANAMLSEEAVLGPVQEDGSYEVQEYSFWSTATDAGYYFDASREKQGVMRFLFAADIDAENVLASGVKYIKAIDITETVTGEAVNGTSVDGEAATNAFYGDIISIPENTTGDYYAVAYITTEDGTVWSDFVKCTPNFSKFFTDYTGGAN